MARVQDTRPRVTQARDRNPTIYPNPRGLTKPSGQFDPLQGRVVLGKRLFHGLRPRLLRLDPVAGVLGASRGNARSH